MGWEEISEADVPDWLMDEIADNYGSIEDGLHEGDRHMYLVERIPPQGHNYRFCRQLKSDYYRMTNERGYCPNCQKYIRRKSGDAQLTCHRCGWTIGQDSRVTDFLASLKSSVGLISILTLLTVSLGIVFLAV